MDQKDRKPARTTSQQQPTMVGAFAVGSSPSMRTTTTTPAAAPAPAVASLPTSSATTETFQKTQPASSVSAVPVPPFVTATLIPEENENLEVGEVFESQLPPPQPQPQPYLGQQSLEPQPQLAIENVLIDDAGADMAHNNTETDNNGGNGNLNRVRTNVATTQNIQMPLEPPPLVEASPMKQSTDDLWALFVQSKKVQLFLCALVLATICLTLGIVFGVLKVHQQDKSNDHDDLGGVMDETPTYPPSISSGIDAQESFLSLLPDFTLESLKNPSSHASMIFDWLWNEDLDYILTLSESLRLQRFSVSLTALAASNRTITGLQVYGWLLAGVSECDWFSVSVSGLVCDTEGRYRVVDVPGFELIGTIPPEIMLASHLAVVELSDNQLVGSIPSQIGQLTELQRLSISGSKLTGSIPSELIGLTKLESIQLYGNQLTGTIPTLINNLTKLRTFAVGSNSLSGTIPTGIRELTGLRFLGLQNNLFSGTVPSSLGQMTDLLTVQFDRNRFTGTISTELGSLLQVEYLLFHENFIIGTIPTELGQNSLVRLLTLHRTGVEGTIPDEICKLKDIDLQLLTHDCKGVLCSCNCTCITGSQEFLTINLGLGS